MFKTGFKQIVLNSEPDGFTSAAKKLYIPGYVTIDSAAVIGAIKTAGVAPELGEQTITLPAVEVGDMVDVKLFISSGDGRRVLPEMFSYEEVKLVTAKATGTGTAADDIVVVFDKNSSDEFFSQGLFELTGAGADLTVTFLSGYEGFNVTGAEVSVTKIVDGLPTGAVIESSLAINTGGTEGTIGINTGKQIEAEVRNATFDNIDPYGIHFGGNDQGVDVRGLYTSFIFETVDDHMAGWAPHAGLGYGDANTSTTYEKRGYIIYVNSADTALIGKITTALA